MSSVELIAALTDICTTQAAIIKDQAFALEQLGAQVREDEAEAARLKLRELMDE